VDWLQAIATVLAVGGVMLNNRRHRACFLFWFVSNVICLGYHWRADLVWLAARDVIFTVLAVDGWVRWGALGPSGEGAVAMAVVVARAAAVTGAGAVSVAVAGAAAWAGSVAVAVGITGHMNITASAGACGTI